MVVINGYSIIQYPNQNKIVICMPPTTETVTNTIEQVRNRKQRLSNDELTFLLIYTISKFENEE